MAVAADDARDLNPDFLARFAFARAINLAGNKFRPQLWLRGRFVCLVRETLKLAIGEFVQVKITRAFDYDIEGEVVG